MKNEELFRQHLIDALHRELVGPDLPPYDAREDLNLDSYVEVLYESPIQRYSAGVLFPQSQPINEIENTDPEETSTDNVVDSPEMHA